MTLALGIIASVALVVIGLVGAGLSAQLQGEQHTVGTEIANDLLERVRANGYLTIPPDAQSFDGREAQPAVDGFPPSPYPRPAYAPEYSLLVESEPAGRNLRRVRVTVFSKTSSTRLESLFHP